MDERSNPPVDACYMHDEMATVNAKIAFWMFGTSIFDLVSMRARAGSLRLLRRARSDLRMDAKAEYRNRSAVAIIGGVFDELIIRGEGEAVAEGGAVIGLDDLFEPWIGQASVADQDAEAAIGQIFPGVLGDVVDHAGEAGRVPLPVPAPLQALYARSAGLPPPWPCR